MPSSPNKILRDAGLERREVTLWLRKEPLDTQHFCMFCRRGLFKSRLRVFAMIYGNGIVETFLNPPISLQCSGCGTVYHMQGLNE